MATNRIVMSPTLTLAQRIRGVIIQGALFREQLSELNLVLGGNGYNGDASLATDAGLSAGDQTRLQNLVIQANNEMNGLATTQVSVGSATGTRQLIDAISTVG